MSCPSAGSSPWTPEHRAQLARDGYTVVEALAPEALLAPAREAIASWAGADLRRPETWYAHDPLVWSVVPLHHAQAFWDLRQHPGAHEVFSALWGTPKLWVSMDRAIFKVPRDEAHPRHVDESVLHWDLDPRSTPRDTWQGMLFLTDARAGSGAFACVPSLYRDLDAYLQSHPGPLLEVPVDLGDHPVISVPARAGDLVLWSAHLPHHGGPNRGPRPRLSVALTMFPEGTEDERRERVACWREKRAPLWWRGWKGQQDPEPGAPAELTALGRYLAGVTPWP